MPVVSVTRLHLRSLRFMPAFIVYAIRSTRQAQRAGGFRAGWLGNERARGFWTATTWDSSDAMRAYRNGAPHLHAMKKLLNWCDEASFVHWEQAGAEPPDAETAFRRLRAEGSLSKVLHPSETHQAGLTVGGVPPRPSQRLMPK